MHDQIYKKIENILSEFNIDGKVAEMGVNPRNTLLDSPILKDCEEKIGIVNMIKQKPKKYSDFTTIIENINNLSFSDNYFNCIICNAMLEHDKFFWKSLSEMIRVLKKGGLLIIGVPSYKNIDWAQNFPRPFCSTKFAARRNLIPHELKRLCNRSYKLIACPFY